jgi:hypothetical protein
MLFFNMILRLILEGYMDYTMSSLLNVRDLVWVTASDKFVSLFSITTFSVVLSFPFLAWCTLWLRQGTLEESDSELRFGSLYEELRTDSRASLMYNTI